MIRKSTLWQSISGSLLTLFFVVFSFTSQAQVTTASISGTVADEKGEGLPGATVMAIHVLSGTKYGAVTNISGRYTMPAVRVGGPFKVTVTFVGYKEQVRENVMTNLATSTNLNFKMNEEGKELSEVVVRASKSDVFSSERTGASSTLGKDALAALPTIGSRSISDFTKYNPQGNGRSFGGADPRLNNFTIDGSQFNNGFGLGSSSQAGGRTGSTAISLDAIEQVQVNVAPFDVRQSGFVGAGLNAVTRSGTNEISGSAYTFMRDNSSKYVGNLAKGNTVTAGKFNENIYGFRVGGPILKDKLFFFINGEFQKKAEPATPWVANGSTNGGTQTRVSKADLDAVSSLLSSKYGYTTGPYEAFDNETNSNKFLARLDYNLNDKNKLTARYTYHKSSADVVISNSNSAGFGNRTLNANSMAYQNSGYIIQDNTNSIVTELNTQINNKMANNVIIGYDMQNEDRAYKTDKVFPTIDILNNNATYISVGMDPFTPSNKLNYGTFHITDNLTIFSGKHTFTVGANYEKYKSNNLFFPAANSVYIYNSLKDFTDAVNGGAIAPARFQLRYSALEGGKEPLQVLKVNKFDVYGQDDFQVSDNFKIALGLRASVISFGQTGLENKVISDQNYSLNGAAYKLNTGTLPSTKILWEPRLGFNWDVTGKKSTQIRGGSGIFTGRPPYVFVSNQVGNNGILTGFVDVLNDKTKLFSDNPAQYIPATPTLPSTFDIAGTDGNYKFPQVWKTNIAIDQQLPLGFIATVEYINGKNLNAVRYYDVNLEPSTAQFTGVDTRPRFPASGLTGTASANAQRINDNVSRAALLSSQNIGDNYSLTFKLEKKPSHGLGGMFAYTKSRARDLMSAGSIASGSWTGARSVNGNNNLPLTYSDFDIPSRAIGYLTYRIGYGKKAGGATTFGLGYEGGYGNSRYSYTISGDMNGDGVAGNDLLFVPNKASDLIFVDRAASGNTPLFTASEQATAFEKFISQDPYLNSKRGKYVDRNGSFFPWLNQVDLNILQDIYVNVKGKRNTIQAGFVIQNLGNLINSDWGVGKTLVGSVPLAFVAVNKAGEPTYRFNTQTGPLYGANGITTLLRDTFVNRASVTDVWRGQFSLRYIFN
jgi:hypothetical protein